MEVSINNQIHSRIIGGKGRTVRKLMEQFKTDIRFPRGENPDLVQVTGTQENCEACIEHLLVLEEEYVSSSCCVEYIFSHFLEMSVLSR